MKSKDLPLKLRNKKETHSQKKQIHVAWKGTGYRDMVQIGRDGITEAKAQI